MTNRIPYVTHLDGIARCELILGSQVVALGVGRLVFVVLTEKHYPAWLDCRSRERDGCQSRRKGTDCAVAECDGRIGRQIGKFQVELERKIIVCLDDGVLKAAIENTVPAANNELPRQLIRKPYAR